MQLAGDDVDWPFWHSAVSPIGLLLNGYRGLVSQPRLQIPIFALAV